MPDRNLIVVMLQIVNMKLKVTIHNHWIYFLVFLKDPFGLNGHSLILWNTWGQPLSDDSHSTGASQNCQIDIVPLGPLILVPLRPLILVLLGPFCTKVPLGQYLIDVTPSKSKHQMSKISKTSPFIPYSILDPLLVLLGPLILVLLGTLILVPLGPFCT